MFYSFTLVYNNFFPQFKFGLKFRYNNQYKKGTYKNYILRIVSKP